MFIGLENAQGEWFTFRMSHIDQNTGDIVWGEPIEGVKVQIRSWKPFFEEQFAKRERFVEWKVNPKTRQNERHSYLKDLTPDEIIKQKEDAIDYAIVGLEGWKDKKTREVIECTRANKIALMQKDFFDRFFADCQGLIDSQSIEQEALATKNS